MMILTRERDPQLIEQYSHIRPAPTWGPLRCFDRCPGSKRTCTLAKDHSGPHVSHGLFKKVMAVWDNEKQETDKNTDYLDEIVIKLASNLRENREFWWEDILAHLRTRTEEEDIRVTRSTLSGQAEFALMGYQILLGSQYIATHNYIAQNDADWFAGALWEKVCGTDLDTCLEYLKKYSSEADSATQIWNFCADLAKYICQDDAPLEETMVVVDCFEFFCLDLHREIAAAFGDEHTVQLLIRKIESLP